MVVEITQPTTIANSINDTSRVLGQAAGSTARSATTGRPRTLRTISGGYAMSTAAIVNPHSSARTSSGPGVARLLTSLARWARETKASTISLIGSAQSDDAGGGPGH